MVLSLSSSWGEFGEAILELIPSRIFRCKARIVGRVPVFLFGAIILVVYFWRSMS